MTEPKPLTSAERAKIAEFLGDGTDDRCALNQYWSQKVLADGAYWRAAVRRGGCYPTENEPCVYCGKYDGEQHTAECEYRLAQNN